MSAKHFTITGFILLMSLTMYGQNQPVYNGLRAIKEMHDGWLVVRLPGFEKKLNILDSLLNMEALSKSGRKKLIKEQHRTMKEKLKIELFYPESFGSAFTFTRVAFIHNAETEAFQKGKIPARTSSGEPLDSLYLKDYFFATLDGALGKAFHFTSGDHREIGYPFPNNIRRRGIEHIPVIAPSEKFYVGDIQIYEGASHIALKHVIKLDKKRRTFYEKKYERLAKISGN